MLDYSLHRFTSISLYRSRCHSSNVRLLYIFLLVSIRSSIVAKVLLNARNTNERTKEKITKIGISALFCVRPSLKLKTIVYPFICSKHLLLIHNSGAWKSPPSATFIVSIIFGAAAAAQQNEGVFFFSGMWFDCCWFGRMLTEFSHACALCLADELSHSLIIISSPWVVLCLRMVIAFFFSFFIIQCGS